MAARAREQASLITRAKGKVAPVEMSNMRSFMAKYMGLLLSEPLKAASCCSVRVCAGTTCNGTTPLVLPSSVIEGLCSGQ